MKSRTNHPVDKHIGLRIRSRRTELGRSQDDLARALGVSFQQVQKYEKGLNGARGSRLYQIAQALDVEVSYFYEGIPQDGKGSAVSPPSLVDEFMASSDGVTIAQAFVRIADPKVRRTIAVSIANLSEALAPAETVLMAAE